MFPRWMYIHAGPIASTRNDCDEGWGTDIDRIDWCMAWPGTRLGRVVARVAWMPGVITRGGEDVGRAGVDHVVNLTRGSG